MQALARVVARSGEPLIRAGVDRAMRLMGRQFVDGETIEQALADPRARLEVARRRRGRAGDAVSPFLRHARRGGAHRRRRRRLLHAYEHAIDAIGRAAAGRGPIGGPGISVKLSALHPRYARAQRERAMAELYPRLAALAARRARTTSASTSTPRRPTAWNSRSTCWSALCLEPALAGWNGLGFVVQAYQKRCPQVIDWLVDLARRSGQAAHGAAGQGRLLGRRDQARAGDRPRRLPGLHAQGAHRRLLSRLRAAAARRAGAIYPQFATHNAHTLAAVHQMARPARWHAAQYEFQCLHGMGEPLYELVTAPRTKAARAAVPHLRAGRQPPHAARLPGAAAAGKRRQHFVRQPHRRPLGADRRADRRPGGRRRGARRARRCRRPAAPGDPAAARPLRRRARQLVRHRPRRRRPARRAGAVAARGRRPALARRADRRRRRTRRRRGDEVRNPADRRDVVGRVRRASPADVADALDAAAAAFRAGRRRLRPSAPRCSNAPPHCCRPTSSRSPACSCARRDAPSATPSARCARRSTSCATTRRRRGAAGRRRRHAAAARARPAGLHQPVELPARDLHRPDRRALAAGNAVLAKPAEQTPLVAAHAVRLLHRPACRRDALQLLPGAGEASARRWSPTRACAACSSPARTASRAICSARSPAGSTATAARRCSSPRRAASTRWSPTRRRSPSRWWPTC